MKGNHNKRKKKELKDLYLLVKQKEQKEKKEYQNFLERLSESSALSGDFAGELLLSMPGKNCILIRNFTSVTEYSAERIRVRSKKYECFVEGRFLRFSYFLPEELKIVGEISQLSFPKTER